MNTEAIPQLTTLLAAHGVYALTILFLFYQQRRTYADFKGASDENRLFLRRVYRSSVVATYVLAALSTAAWGYSTFHSPPYVWLDGAIDDVKNASTRPTTPRDPPSVVQSIVPDSGLHRFMSQIGTCDPGSGLCQLVWAIKTRSDVRTLGFKFLHSYHIAKARPSASDPHERPQSDEALDDYATVGSRFTLDTAALDLAAGRELALRYVQNPDTKLIGTLYFRTDQQWVPLPWDTLPAGPQATSMPHRQPIESRWPLARLWTVWAAEVGKAPFGTRGEYQEDFGRNLRGWLGGQEVPLQQRGVQILIDGRDRAFKFILDSQSVTLPGGVNRSILTGNLARAAVEIEARGTKLPNDLVVSLAVASSQSGSYETSARLFDKMQSAPLGQTDAYFYRGLAYRETRRYREAIADLEYYARTVASPYSKAVAYTSIGISHRRNKNTVKAIQSYELAIRTYPSYVGPYNSLAYLYALDERRTDFSEALALVNKALAMRPDEPNYLDTKGCVLFRMGKLGEAKTLIAQAQGKLPGDPDIEAHLAKVTKAIAQGAPRGRC
jgi:hypothetical protein